MEKTYVIVRSVKEGNRLIRRVNKEHPGAAGCCGQLPSIAGVCQGSSVSGKGRKRKALRRRSAGYVILCGST